MIRHGTIGRQRSMASALFRMGFSRAVVEKKWPGIRAAFSGFPRDFSPFGRYIDRLMRERGETGLIEDLGKRFVRLSPKPALVFLRMTGHEMPETMAKFAAHQH